MIKINEGTCSPFWSMPELLVKTASFLSPKNIACLLTVSSQWYQHLGSNELWIMLCPRISVENPSDHFYLIRYPDLMGIHLARGMRMGQLKVLKSLQSGTKEQVANLKVFGETILAYFGDGKIRIWDRSICLQATSSVLNHEFCKTEIDLSDGGPYLSAMLNNNYVIASAVGKDVLIRDLFTNHTVCCVINAIEDRFPCLAINDKIIAFAAEDKTIQIYDETGSLQRILRGSKDDISCLEISDKTVISGSHDGTIHIWDQDTDWPLQTLHGYQTEVAKLEIIDTVIVSVDACGTICVWDRSTYTLQHTLKDDPRALTTLEMVDNIMVIGWCHTPNIPNQIAKTIHTMEIRDLYTGTLLHTRNVESGIWHVKFADNILFIGTWDGEIQLWGL